MTAELVTECAALAPSVHNTQPWDFAVTRSGVGVVADRSRQLSFLDPEGRLLAISCGAAIEFGRLGARAAGCACAVELLPDPSHPDLLARLELGAPLPATDEESRLAAAIAVRYTDRGPYSDRPVPPGVVADVARRAADLGAWVRVIDSTPDRGAVTAVLAAAEAAEAAEPEYAGELRRWTGDGETGMPAAAVAVHWPQDRVSDVPLRDFTGADRHPRPGDVAAGPPPKVERDLVLIIGTDTDDPGAWLTAGRLLGWTLLRAAADGISAQPLGQAIDLASGRDRLRRELGLVGHPQFVLRLGFGEGRPATHRRPPGAH